MTPHKSAPSLALCVALVLCGGAPALARRQSAAPPARQPGAARPADAARLDEADLYWKSRPKYFLVVAASKTAGVGTDLPFTKVDGQKVSQALASKGYERLDLLEGRRATLDNFLEQLQRIRAFEPEAVVVVYYSGHGVKDPQEKDLWLQLYGQTQFKDHFGLSLSGLVGAARGSTYKGDLVIILDSCYSGHGAVTSQLSLREADRTVIFASSSTYQKSYSINRGTPDEMSAFTHYLLAGLGPDWAQVDGDADGIVLYSDLQAYISNRLLQLLRDEGRIGPMEPQLVGQTPKIWAAYDAGQVRNWETQPRKTLTLQRSFEMQNPETLMGALASPLPADAHAYLRALLALKEKRFDEAWRLLEKAEAEKRVSRAEIFWARAGVKLEQGDLLGGRDWLEKALGESPREDVDLVAVAAGVNFALGNWARAEELFKRVLELSGEGAEESEEVVSSMVFLTMLNFFGGDKAEADLYLGRLKRIDPKVLDSQEDGLSNMIPFFEIISDVIQGNREGARRRLEDVRKSVPPGDDEMQQMLRFLVETVDAALNEGAEGDSGGAPAGAAGRLAEWDDVLRRKDVNRLMLLLTQLQVQATGPGASSLASAEAGALLKRTVELAREHRSAKGKVTAQTPSGPVEVEVAEGAKGAPVVSSQLLAAAAFIYDARDETAEAEKLLKESIGLVEGETTGAVLALNSVMGLARLYTGAGRFGEAENLYKRFLLQVREQMGEGGFHHALIQEELGELYERQEKWVEAEESYRALPRLSRPGGAPDILGLFGQEKLATFLLERGRYEESVRLFEEALAWVESRKKNSLVPAEKPGEYNFKLAQGYYWLGRYAAAEKALRQAAELFASSREPDPLDALSCLIWQWATARVQNKADEAGRFHHNLIKLAESELARPRPNQELGARLLSLSATLTSWDAFDEAERLRRLALDVQTKVYGPGSPEVAYVWEQLANLSHTRKRYGEALGFLKTAREMYEQQTPREPESLFGVVYSMGVIRYQRAEFEQSAALLQEAVNMLPQLPEHVRIRMDAEFYLGRVLRKRGQYDAAQRHLRAMLEQDERAARPSQWSLTRDLYELAAVARSRGERAEAEQLLARSEAALRNVPRTETVTGMWGRLAYERAMLAESDGKAKKAEQLFREAVEKGGQDPQTDAVMLVEFLDAYASALRKRGKGDEAAQVEQRARQLLASVGK